MLVLLPSCWLCCWGRDGKTPDQQSLFYGDAQAEYLSEGQCDQNEGGWGWRGERRSDWMNDLGCIPGGLHGSGRSHTEGQGLEKDVSSRVGAQRS